MITLSVGTILGFAAIVFTILAAACTLGQKILDGRDEWGEELAKDVKRKKSREARKQWQKTIIASNGKKYKLKQKRK